jgi:CheY-like chemotaxis protein
MSFYPKLKKPFQILVAEDDADDRELLLEAFQETNKSLELVFVHDGLELLEYLHKTGRYQQSAPLLPNLILLDFNMPKKDGREVLKQIKQNPELAHIPVLVLSTSQSDDDVTRAYQLGGNGFITKPATYKKMLSMAESIYKFWFIIARIP